MFISFINFYQRFILLFSKIAVPFTSKLKITELLNKLFSKAFKAGINKFVRSGDSKVNKTVVNLFKNNKFRNSIYIPNIRAIGKTIFLTLTLKSLLTI